MFDQIEPKSSRELLREPPPEVNELSHLVIGAAIEVHRHLGPGFVEGVYEEALAIEFRMRAISFERQALASASYKGMSVGEGRVDFLVGGILVVEIKAVRALIEGHRAQVMSYLKALRQPLGLLLNFGAPTMRQGIERIVLSVPS